MDPEPPVLRPTDLIRTAADVIMSGRYRRLPVVGADGRYEGMFGVNCLLGMVLPKAIMMEEGENLAHIPRDTLSDLPRMGKKTLENLRDAIDFRKRSAGRTHPAGPSISMTSW